MTEALQRPSVTSSNEAAEYIIPLLQDLNHEACCVMYLNHSNRILRQELVSQGGITGTVIDIRIILKNALLNNANKLIIAHNHPSGNDQPSRADKELTIKMKEAAAYMDIQLIDHLIIAGARYLSMADEGML